MDDILKTRGIRRNLIHEFGRWRAKANWAEHIKGKPAGNRHTSLAQIPKRHISSRVQQDIIYDMMKRKIRHTPPGPRRDFLKRDLELWIANGKPTYGHFQDSKHRDKLSEPIKTWQKGKPLYTDFQDTQESDKLIRRALYGRSVA